MQFLFLPMQNYSKDICQILNVSCFPYILLANNPTEAASSSYQISTQDIKGVVEAIKGCVENFALPITWMQSGKLLRTLRTLHQHISVNRWMMLEHHLIQMNWYRPLGVTKAVLARSSVATGICQCPLVRARVEMNSAFPCKAINDVIYPRGIGYASDDNQYKTSSFRLYQHDR